MRIIAVRLEPVARVLSIVYAAFGLGAFSLFEFTDTPYLTLPIGVIGPLLHLNLNLNLPRSTSILYIFFSGVAAVLTYALTGWITGAVATLCFNVVAKQLGGIDAKYVSTVNGEKTAEFQDSHT
jgi:hypothetical protein